jgi:hypothetical protein
MAPQLGSPPAPMPMPAPSPSASAQPDIFAQAKQQWPLLDRPDIAYKYTPRSGPNVPYLEAYPPGEAGDASAPRPSQFPMGQYGIEVYKPTTRPIDVLGDVVSHFLVNTDPVIKSYYENFQQSLTPEQQERLQSQYQHAVQNGGEKRPYATWLKMSGLPAYFRGYAFQQWPNAQKLYTPEQLKNFDAMMQYLSGAKPAAPH